MHEHIRVMVGRAVEAGLPREQAEELCRNIACGFRELVFRAVEHRVATLGWRPVPEAVVYAIANAANDEIEERVEAIADAARQRAALVRELDAVQSTLRLLSEHGGVAHALGEMAATTGGE